MHEYKILTGKILEIEHQMATLLDDMENNKINYPKLEANKRFVKLQKKLDNLYKLRKPLEKNIVELTGLEDIEKYSQKISTEERADIENRLMIRGTPERVMKTIYI